MNEKRVKFDYPEEGKSFSDLGHKFFELKMRELEIKQEIRGTMEDIITKAIQEKTYDLISINFRQLRRHMK